MEKDRTQIFSEAILRNKAKYARRELEDEVFANLPPPPSPKPYVSHKFTLKEALPIISSACNPCRYLP